VGVPVTKTGPKTDPPLENYANNVSTPLISAFDRRAARYQNRQFLWERGGLERVRKCGRVRVSPDGLVAVRCSNGVAGFAGLATCSSVWACPVCNAKIMAVRALEIGGAVTAARARGWFVGMTTLTMRHHRGQSLAQLWDGLAHAWRRVIQGREWAQRRHLGWRGQVRAVEVTNGPNGWHVHVHVLLFLEGGADAAERYQRLSVGMFNRWASGLQSMGFAEPLLVGQDWHEIKGADDLALGQYLTKAVDPGTIGLELTSSQTKGATWSKTLPPWAYLNAARTLGDAEALRVWQEYETASHGRRQLTWSNGLRDELGIGQELTDEDIATAEVGTSSDDVAFITGAGWASLASRDRVHLIPEILDTVRLGGWVALASFLERHEIEHTRA
jgi:hypothetical protein